MTRTARVRDFALGLLFLVVLVYVVVAVCR